MAGESNLIFGNLPPGYRTMSSARNFVPPRYAAMPSSRNIDDRRGQKQPGADMSFEEWVNSTSDDRGGISPDDLNDINPETGSSYAPSPMGGAPMQPGGGVGDVTWARGRLPSTGAYGPNPYYSSGPHPAPQQPPFNMPQGITPGSPGWMTPPSPSGPHPQTYAQGQGPQPPIFSPQGWQQPPGSQPGPLAQNALQYYMQNAGYGQ
jgi:hypothetical protein